MAKTDAKRRSKRQSKVVTNEVVEEKDNGKLTETDTTGEQIIESNKDIPTERRQGKQDEENQNDQDSQMDPVIEVKGNKCTVTVSWDKMNQEGEADDAEKRTSTTGQMTSGEDKPSETTEVEMEQEPEESPMDIVVGENKSTPAVTVTWEKKNEEGENTGKETSGGEQLIVKETALKGKRKAPSTAETSPSKKTKLVNDGFCLFVGNLNNSKPYEEVKDSLASYLMKQSLVFQDIRLDRSKKHAHVDLASAIDLNKALTLNGEMVLDKPMRIEKAKVRSAEKVKVSAKDKKAARDSRCLFLKNVPYSATTEDIMKVFCNAVAVRFPGGAEGPTKGIAFVEFKNQAIVQKILQGKRVAKIQDRVLIVDCVGEANRPKVAKTSDDDNTKAPPSNTLFLSNLSHKVKENNLKSVFQKAVSITVPQRNGKPRGFAFVEFATVAEAEKALQSSQDMKICKRPVKVKFEEVKVLSKTLIVMGLAEKTTAETLQSAFEGALSARVAVDKETGVSKRFGFVEFESDENCKAVKAAMEDCEIDGSKVTLAYAKAKAKGEKGPPGAGGGPAGRPSGQAAGQGAAKGGRKARSRRGKGRGAGKQLDAVKEVETKG